MDWARRVILERLAGRDDKVYLFQLLADVSEEVRDQKMKPAVQKVYTHIRHEFDTLASSIARVSQATVWRP